MLNTTDIRNIYRKKNSIPMVANNRINMNLLDNKILFWNSINENADYAFVELIKEVNEKYNDLELFMKIRVNSLINENIIYFLSENMLDTIINNKIEITNETKELILETVNNIKYYNRVKSNIDKLNTKINFSNIVKYNLDPNKPEWYTESKIYDIVDRIIEVYPTLEPKVLYSITNECLLMANALYNLEMNNSVLVYETTKAFIDRKNLEHSDVKLVLENTKIENNHDYLFYLMGEDTIIQEKDSGLKVTDKKSVKDMIASFEIQNNKSVESLKKFVNKLYQRPLKDIVDETPFLLGIIRKFFVIGGSFLINPVLAIVVGITDFCIENQMDKQQAEKYLKQLQSEKKKAEKKMDSLKSEKHIKNNKEYIEKLDASIAKVEKYIDEIKSSKEKDDEWKLEENTTTVNAMAAILAIEECFNLFDVEDNNRLTVILTEGKITNSLKLAGETLKGKLKSLTGKEKILCQRLDASMDRFIKSIESALTNKKREDIVKGRILPSFSRMMKMAIGGTALYAVNPLLAIIGALGSLAVTSAATVREKQYILDEIDIHLKIVEKKIHQAEMNGDEKGLEELYKVEHKLNREKQRIKYNMKVYYNK